jgi:hypothetical protein
MNHIIIIIIIIIIFEIDMVLSMRLKFPLRVSSSVHAGEFSQLNPMQLIAPLSMSPSWAGKEDMAGTAFDSSGK